MGSYNRANLGSNPGERMLQYRRVVAHPLYSTSRPFDNNYALLELNETITSSQYVRPICLPDETNVCSSNTRSYDNRTRTIDTCSQVVAAGWGLSALDGTWQYPNELRHVAMDFLSRDQCSTLTNGELLDNELCAGGTDGRDTCIADEGGPLMCLTNNRYTILGVTSAGTSPICGLDDRPGIYSRVCSVIQWIRQIVSGR